MERRAKTREEGGRSVGPRDAERLRRRTDECNPVDTNLAMLDETFVFSVLVHCSKALLKRGSSRERERANLAELVLEALEALDWMPPMQPPIGLSSRHEIESSSIHQVIVANE